MPVVEKGVGDRGIPVEKYRCPACANKELPFLDHRDAARRWNAIAPVSDYHKRTLAYNMHGVCVDEPCKVFKWRDRKKTYNNVTIAFYRDSGMYYYGYSYWYENGGGGTGLWINDPCFPSMEAAKKHALKTLSERDEDIAGIVKRLLFTPEQGELF
jgi:hypothetical protein